MNGGEDKAAELGLRPRARIVAMALACGIATTLLTVYLGKRLWAYNLERMVAIYGVVTGTVSSAAA